MSSGIVPRGVPQTRNLEERFSFTLFPIANGSPTRTPQSVDPTHGHRDFPLPVAEGHTGVSVRLWIEALPAQGDVDVVHRLPNEGQQLCG